MISQKSITARSFKERENDITMCCSFQMYYIVYVNLNRMNMRTGKKKKKLGQLIEDDE